MRENQWKKGKKVKKYCKITNEIILEFKNIKGEKILCAHFFHMGGFLRKIFS